MKHSQSGVVHNFSNVCMYVCLTITFEGFDVGSLFLFVQYIFAGYELGSYMKVMGLRSRSQEQKTWNVIPPPHT